jgi:threonyl-tRNA synthetase
MQMLLIHADYIEYRAKSKTPLAEDVPDEQKGARSEETLVAFIAVEKVDEKEPEIVAIRACEEIVGVFNEVKAKEIMLYPYAHLSSSLGKPDIAVKILKSIEERLKGDYSVKRAPFGWYKAFNVACKGHPLSELSRHIMVGEGEEAEEKVSKAVSAEKKLKKEWYVLDVSGELVPAKDFNFSKYPSLKTFYNYETSGTRVSEKEPPHIRLMKEHQLVDHEPGSDSGNLRWYPKGTLIKKLLEEHVSNILIKYGGMQVETPIMYDFEHPKLKKYLNRFPARQYVVTSDDKEYFLRFAACFGQYLMKHDMQISYKHLPVRLYELTHYSFRREQSGELAGLKRLRAFTMPDMHTLCRDMEQAREEFLNQYRLSMEWMKDVGLEYDIAMRFVKDFYNENEALVKEIQGLAKRPVLIELWDERFFYFVMKFEFNVIDALKKAAALSTVQIDVENAELFDINYVDEDNTRKHPLLLHASISGGIDRVLYAILETQWIASQKGKKPMFPVWLSPTQVRLIPVAEGHMEHCEKLLEEFENSQIRTDIDDESNTLQKKIRSAEKEWIPYIAIIGDKEVESGTLSIRVRSTGKQEGIATADLIGMIKEETYGKPTKRLALPNHTSKRPGFR